MIERWRRRRIFDRTRSIDIRQLNDQLREEARQIEETIDRGDTSCRIQILRFGYVWEKTTFDFERTISFIFTVELFRFVQRDILCLTKEISIDDITSTCMHQKSFSLSVQWMISYRRSIDHKWWCLELFVHWNRVDSRTIERAEWRSSDVSMDTYYSAEHRHCRNAHRSIEMDERWAKWSRRPKELKRKACSWFSAQRIIHRQSEAFLCFTAFHIRSLKEADNTKKCETILSASVFLPSRNEEDVADDRVTVFDQLLTRSTSVLLELVQFCADTQSEHANN